MTKALSGPQIQAALTSVGIDARAANFNKGVFEMLNMMRELLTPEDKTPITQYTPEVASKLQAGIDKFMQSDSYKNGRLIIDEGRKWDAGQGGMAFDSDLILRGMIMNFYTKKAEEGGGRGLPEDQAFEKFMEGLPAEKKADFLKNPDNVRKHMPQVLGILEKSRDMFAGLTEIANKSKELAAAAKTAPPSAPRAAGVPAPVAPPVVPTPALPDFNRAAAPPAGSSPAPVTPAPVVPAPARETSAPNDQSMKNSIKTPDEAVIYVKTILAKLNPAINEQIEGMKAPVRDPQTGKSGSQIPFFIKLTSLEEPGSDPKTWGEQDQRAVQSLVQFLRSGRGMNIPADPNNLDDDARLYSPEIGKRILRGVPAFVAGMTPEQRERFETGMPDKGEALIHALNMLHADGRLSAEPLVEKGPMQVAGWMKGILGKIAPIVLSLLKAVGIDDAPGLVNSFMNENFNITLADIVPDMKVERKSPATTLDQPSKAVAGSSQKSGTEGHQTKPESAGIQGPRVGNVFNAVAPGTTIVGETDAPAVAAFRQTADELTEKSPEFEPAVPMIGIRPAMV